VERWNARVAGIISRHPFLLFFALYGVIAALTLLAVPLLPEPLRRAIEHLTGGSGLGVVDPAAFGRQAIAAPPLDTPLWAIAAVSMVAAGTMATPVAWLYTITRQKRGYRQSVVHTLILLPVIVGGVVVLVKFSLALAFSLAGIVAAVRFRTTLEDSKDAAYVFVATGIGLASGVELHVAATLSVLFNLVTLLLFHSDFGRTPARLEGERAEQRMQRALEIANRTSQFVARLDREILSDLAPEQLDALVGRAQRHRRGEAGTDDTNGGSTRFEGTIRVRTDGSHRAREALELLLGQDAKTWSFRGSATGEDGSQRLEYTVRLRKSVTPAAFLDHLRADPTTGILEGELA
jgi:ABC-type molybdate transport system permease subunit